MPVCQAGRITRQIAPNRLRSGGRGPNSWSSSDLYVSSGAESLMPVAERREREKEERRSAILDAAEKVFLEKSVRDDRSTESRKTGTSSPIERKAL